MSEVDAKVDPVGRTIRISAGGLVRIDEIAIARLIRRPDGVYLQVRDQNRARSITRGTEYVEVRIEALLKTLLNS